MSGSGLEMGVRAINMGYDKKDFIHSLSKNPCLTICISCKGISSILNESLIALEKQELDKKKWKVILLVNDNKQLLSVEQAIKSISFSVEVLSCFYKNSLQGLRNKMLDQIKTPLLFFIDEDVILQNKNHLENLIRFHIGRSEMSALGGGYLSGKGCSFWGQTYNWISRLWMLENPGFSPAGNLSVKTNFLNLKCRFKSPLDKGFGGEEIYFFKKMRQFGEKYLWEKELDAFHKARHTFKSFLKRAFAHGKSQAFFPPKNNFYKSMIRFIRQPGSFSIKTTALFYLLVVRAVSFWTASQKLDRFQ